MNDSDEPRYDVVKRSTPSTASIAASTKPTLTVQTLFAACLDQTLGN
jgi:hypothetical protein